MLILLTMSSIVMAEDERTVTITNDIPEESRTRETELTESINQSFTWVIPAKISLTDNSSFTVKVTQAHLYSDVHLKISMDGNGMVQLVEKVDSFKGSKVTLKKDNSVINSQIPLLTVRSSQFTAEADTDEQIANISLEVERNPFQLAGDYAGKITFTASLSRQ